MNNSQHYDNPLKLPDKGVSEGSVEADLRTFYSGRESADVSWMSRQRGFAPYLTQNADADRAEMKKPSILVVDDDSAIRTGVVDVFLFHGYSVQFAEDGRTGLEMALTGEHDLILLDVMLPELDGFSVCNEIRRNDREQPIIMLTAKTQDEDIITGLALGADDYVVKPFSVRELVLRVEAVLRRSNRALSETRYFSVGPWTIDGANLEATRDAKTLAMTRREVEILQYLKSHANRPVSREELLENVWGYRDGHLLETRTVDIHFAKLRRKIEDDSRSPQIILTIRGEGYKLSKEG